MLDIFWQDLRYAGAPVNKESRIYGCRSAFTLALGIAANATMFSMVSAFLLRRPPVRESERVAVISSVNPAPAFQADATPASAPNYLAWREENHVFEDIAAAKEYGTVSFTAVGQPGGAGQPEALSSAAVSPNYFSVLGVTPQFGRVFEAGEDQLGREHVVILSWELWEEKFASDVSVVGRTIRLDRENYTVLGVMPESFRLLGFVPQLWTPLVLSTADQSANARKDRALRVFNTRFKAGVNLEEARAGASMRHWLVIRRKAFPRRKKIGGVVVRTLPDFPDL